MPKYDNLPVLTEIEQVEKLKNAKEKSPNPLTEEQGRKAVELILKKYSKLGVGNAKARLDYAEKEHAAAKKTLEKMKQLMEEIESEHYIPEIFKLSECKAGLDILKLQQKNLGTDGASMYPLMKEYRSNWEASVKKVCDDTSFLSAYIAIRTKTMTLGKKAVAYTNRVDEYVKRGEIFYKRAEKARKGSEKDTKAVITEARKLTKDIVESANEAERIVRKGTGLLKSMESLKKLKDKYTGKEHRTAESALQDLETNRKDISGLRKTAGISKKVFDKLHSSKSFLLSKEKSDVDSAFSVLEKQVTAAEKDLASGKKVFKELEKLVGKK